jgi:hypothetical protein
VRALESIPDTSGNREQGTRCIASASNPGPYIHQATRCDTTDCARLSDLVLPEIKKSATDSEQFAAKAKVLKDLVEHHATEEREMFPRAKKLMDREELVGGLVAMLTTEVDSDPLTR